MAKRHERRIPLAVPVRVRYTDATGKDAVNTACTLNVSRYGVRLDSAKFLRGASRKISLQFRGRRAEYRVMWVGDENSLLWGQAGLRAVDADNYIWEIPVPPPERDTYQSEALPIVEEVVEPGLPENYDRRNAPRFDCDRGVQCWREGSTVPVWGSLRDLSLTGCKVVSTTPLPGGTHIRVLLNLFGRQVRASGEIRSVDENTMGIQFTRITSPEEAKLHAVLTRLASGTENAPAKLLQTTDILTRLTQWFRWMDFLTREEYLDILNGGTGLALQPATTIGSVPAKSRPNPQ
jgi:hypothetical protein